MKQKNISIKKFIYIVLVITLLVLISFSTYKLISNNEDPKNYLSQDQIKLKDIEYKENQKTEEDKEEPEPTEYEIAQKYFSENIDLDTYRNQHNNPEIVGRLEIPNLFNILVSQSKDNKYYLNHAVDKKKDVKGSEFMDYRVTATSKQINIYGHNSRTYDIPFRKLEQFLDVNFFNSNPYMLFQHDGGTRIYKIFSIKEVTTDNEHMIVSTTEDNHKEHIEILKANSIYTRDVPYDENSNLLILQTCSYNGDDTYYVISAIEIK